MLFNIIDEDLNAVYDQLKDRYELAFTDTVSLDEGFTADCPVLVGRAHGRIIELYVHESMFVLDVMDVEHTKGTHWHPNNVDSAVEYIVEFMEGKSNYDLYPFNQQ